MWGTIRDLPFFMARSLEVFFPLNPGLYVFLACFAYQKIEERIHSESLKLQASDHGTKESDAFENILLWLCTYKMHTIEV